MLNYDVVVIGGGWSGILAAKYMLEENLDVVVFESWHELGGIWAYSDDPDRVTVMRETRLTSSITVTEAADFPFRSKHPEGSGYQAFPSHDEILKYLEDYAESFKVKERIVFNTRVENVTQDGDFWLIDTNNEEYQSVRARYVIVASGLVSTPNTKPIECMFGEYTGNVIVSSKIKSMEDLHDLGRTLVYGGGETASDVVEGLCELKSSSSVTWAIPNGQHFFRKMGGFFKGYQPSILDHASSYAINRVSPLWQAKPGMQWACKLSSTGSLFSYQGHGIPEYRNDAPFLASFANKQGHVLQYVYDGEVTPKRRIVDCQGKRVCFDDDEALEFDTVIMCCGFTPDFSYLPEDLANAPLNEHFRYIFPCEHDNLAFVGTARPAAASIPYMTEVQCMYVAEVFGGKQSLPTPEERRQDVKEQEERNGHHFRFTSRRLKTLVDPLVYPHDITTLMGQKPNFWRLLFTDPSLWLIVFFTHSCAAYHLAGHPDPKKREMAKMMLSKNFNFFWVLAAVGFFIFRILQIDALLAALTELKYYAQTSSIWKKVKKTPVYPYLVSIGNFYWRYCGNLSNDELLPYYGWKKDDAMMKHEQH